MGKPKGKYIHPDQKRPRKEVSNLIILRNSKMDNKSNMRVFVSGKR